MKSGSGRVEECLYLAAHAGLAEFLGFIANQACVGEFDDPRKWTQDWNAASQHLTVLAYTESGYADAAKVIDLPDQLAPLGEQVLASPDFQRAFPVVPTRLGVVELDRLIVCQKYVSVDHVRRIQAALPAALTPEDIFHLCLPPAETCPPVRQFRHGPNSWMLVSPAHGIRVTESVVTDVPPEYPSRGPTWGLVGTVVSFPTNYLNVIQAGPRLILNNGTHRALALLEKGITRIPCAIQQVNNPDELMVVALPEVVQSASHFLQSPRPPLLKDYLDPKLSRRVPVPHTDRYLKVTIQTEVIDVPAEEPSGP